MTGSRRLKPAESDTRRLKPAATGDCGLVSRRSEAKVRLMRIAVADDEIETRETFAFLLERMGPIRPQSRNCSRARFQASRSSSAAAESPPRTSSQAAAVDDRTRLRRLFSSPRRACRRSISSA